MLAPDAVRPTSVAVIPWTLSTTVILGTDSVLGSRAEFSVALEEATGLPSGGLTSTEYREDVTTGVLSTIASKALERARKIERSSDAWTQAGFAAISACESQSAIDAFASALAIDPTSRNAKLGLARANNELGEPERAVAILAELLQQAPHDTSVRVSLALALTGAGRNAEALNLLQATEAVGPLNASMYAVRGGIQLRLGEYRRAISDLRKAVRQKPDWVHALNSLAIAELKAGHARAAEKHFREAARVGPLYEETYLNLLRLLKTQSRWEDLLHAAEARWDQGSAPVEAAVLAGHACLNLDDPRAARMWLSSAREKARGPAQLGQIANDLGVALFRLDRPSEAGEAFEESARATPSDLPVSNRARAFLQEAKRGAALDWLISWQGKIPFERPDLLRTLALCLFYVERHQDAIDVLNSAAMALNRSEETQALLSMIYSDGLQDYDSAIRAARTGLEIDPESCTVLNNLSYALLEAGRAEDAAKVLEGVNDTLADKTTRVCLTATRGLLALHRGELAQGLGGYELALSIAPFHDLREKVKAKRDLETGRAIMRQGLSVEQARFYLTRAAKASEHARPYSLHARRELALLPAPTETSGSTG